MEYHLSFKDGPKRGNLWKPVSDTKKDSKGRLVFVVLFDKKGPGGRKWGKPNKFKKVELFDEIEEAGVTTLKRLGGLSFSKHYDEGSAIERDRQIWKGFTPANLLPKTLAVVATDAKGDKFHFPVENPNKRYD